MSNSQDITARWMACYIAEMMQNIETAQDEHKSELENKCFEIILKLWQQKSFYPDDSLPFRDYDSVFKTLRRISSKEDLPFYVNRSEELTNENEEIQTYINTAMAIDNTVKIWFDHIFNQAIKASTSEMSIGYLRAMLNPDEDEPITINMILRAFDNFDEPAVDNHSMEQKIIEDKIETLKSFDLFNKDMLHTLESQLLDMKKQ